MKDTEKYKCLAILPFFFKFFYIKKIAEKVELYFVPLSDHIPLVPQRSVQFSSVAQSCPTLCDPMDCSTLGLPVHHQLPEFTQTQVH